MARAPKRNQEVDFDDEPKAKKGAPEIGHNLGPVKAAITKARDNIIEIEKKMEDLRCKKAEERAAVAALGIPKKALDDALRRFQMDPDKRTELDEAYSIACEAMGVPLHAVQAEMFEATAPAAKPKKGEQTAPAIN